MCVLGPHGSAAPCPLPVTGTLDTPDGFRFVVSLCSLAVTTSGTIPRFSQTPIWFALGGDVFSCFSLMIPPVWRIKVCIFFFSMWFGSIVWFPFHQFFKVIFWTDSVTETPGDSAGSAHGRHLGRAHGGGSSALRLFSAWQGRTPRQITGWLRGRWQPFKTGLVPGVLLDSQTDQFTFTFPPLFIAPLYIYSCLWSND